MKRSYILVAPPLVFVLAAVAAWLAGVPGDHALLADRAQIPSPRQRAMAAEADGGGIPAALLELESRIFSHAPAELTEVIHDAKGMEDALFSDIGSSGFPGGGESACIYAMDWVKESPEEMFAWLVRQNGKRSFYAYLLFASWAEKDMIATLAAVSKIPDLKVRRQALMTSLQILCKSDPARARELLMQNLSLFPADGDWLVFGGGPAEKTTCDLLCSLPPGEERTNLLARLLSQMNDSSDARSLWDQASESERREWVAAGFEPFMSYAQAFAGLDDLMRERAETSGDPRVVEKFIDCHGEAWAKRDLAAALNWAQAHLKGKRRVESREKFFQTAIRNDFDGTLRVWQNLPEGYLKTSAAEAIQRAVPANKKAEAQAVLRPPSKDQASETR